MVLTQYDYLFALGVIFATLDAWNIGANDVANSWATSVASRSLTLMQAMIGASIFEFGGAVGVGARVADTIRTKIVSPDHYEGQPAVLMLGMVCAIMGSSIWLTIATKIGLPVSTTHSLLGGVVGMGIASIGAEKVTWVAPSSAVGTDKINTGVVSVFLAWIVAPGLSAFFASALFLSTKYGVMLRKDPVKKAFALIPVYFGLTAVLLAMLLIWKGGSYKVDLTEGGIAGAIIGTGVAWAALVAIFFMPWLWRVVVVEDWQLRWYHIYKGPLLLRRPEPPTPPEDFESPIRDFYEGHLTREELDAQRAAENTDDIEAAGGAEAATTQTPTDKEAAIIASSRDSDTASSSAQPRARFAKRPHKSLIGPRPEKLPWHSGAMLFWYFKRAVLHGVDQDVVSAQKEKDMFSGDLEDAHARATHFDNKAEFMYSFLQVMTAATASFTHGANDISNAIGPFATIYEIWRSGEIPSKAPVPTWILAFGAGALVIGLWTYGYNIMRNLGNKLTLNSPSRGFSMELGSAITIIVATRLKLPVSTTQCITGAIVGVGLCNGDWRALNWRMIAWIYGGWIFTLPIAGLISGILMAVILNAPRW
ncbi:phosphate transporter [Astrocystis sublimbata]|nr:phosphate transporter [Astrocystis sublimbata]